MNQTANESVPSEGLAEALRSASAYPDRFDGEVGFHETHISQVFVAGDYAYKIKKPITTSFLDYGTLRKRRHFCEEEVRLDSRYSDGLYLGVVPIVDNAGAIRVDGEGEPIEYAVKMRRFEEDCLLSKRLESGIITTADVRHLANRIAQIHRDAARLQPGQSWGSPDLVFDEACDNLATLSQLTRGKEWLLVESLDNWTEHYFDSHRGLIDKRVSNGFVRECHGDLHLQNVLYWRGELTPFDGIEFSDELRWIDVMSDAAFLAMDFASRDRIDLCRSFINAYLENTGDHSSLALLRWYLVYRALVRAKVDALRLQQRGITDQDRQLAQRSCHQHIRVANQFTVCEQPRLWITHGVSGSGKTTIGERVVQRHDAIRVRSDIERKRFYGVAPTDRPDDFQKRRMYSEASKQATYDRLRYLAIRILQSGYSAIVDATFLKQQHREQFRKIARDEGVPFTILDCDEDESTLRKRVRARIESDTDASDADLEVLENQLSTREPLTDSERKVAVTISESEANIDAI